MFERHVGVLVVILASLTERTQAQGVIATLNPPVGTMVENIIQADIGDVDGDGVTDIAVCGMQHSGPLYVHSGAAQSNTPAPIWSVLLPTYTGPGNLYARSITSTGDWNGDGVPDFAVVRKPDDGNAAYAHVLSGANGTILTTIPPSGSPVVQGWNMLPVGHLDSNADGNDDFAFVEFSTTVPSAKLRVKSPNLTSDILAVTFGPGASPVWPGASCITSDLNADSVPEFVFITGDPTGIGNRIEMRSGFDGQVLNSIPGLLPGAYFDLRSLGDIDGITGPEIAFTQDAWPVQLAVRAMSLASGTDVWLAHVGTQGNKPMDVVPDLNGDGRTDVVIGESEFDFQPGDNQGIARILDGATGALISSVYTNAPQTVGFGSGVVGLSDVNQDGRGDFVVEGYGTATNFSVLRLYSGACGTSNAYGSGCPGGGGSTPSLVTTGCLAGGCDLKLLLNGHSGGNWPVIFVIGTQPAQLPIPYGCDLLVAPPHVVAVWQSTPPSFPGAGSITTVFDVPMLPLAGQTIRMQALCADPWIARGYSVSNGLTLKF